MKKIILLAIIFVLVIICGIQQYIIQEYEQSEQKWVELSKLWREKLDTCMNINDRIYNELYEKELEELVKLKEK